MPGGASLSTCLCIHAEENALLEAGRERIREGSILYCDTCPCLTCSIKITQVGISEVVYSQAYSMDTDAAKIFEEGGVKLRHTQPTASGTESKPNKAKMTRAGISFQVIIVYYTF
ncbi:CMP/dCMP deaminase zinc-binding protein [Macrophomina phaseolina MS6]|uniref:dCMP deaminase n=1 Tax=Macrophomina phaseolina (strain MS6) TaxID=1126212 RepID=K2RF54_MACPH|nr:CMP/dCMP deaminase zinc-binding protein [Macrophomina phaseolina MS6]